MTERDGIQVLLVDDHKVMRASLRQLFEMTDDVRVAAECECGAEALEAVKSPEDFDVILLDMRLPDIAGIDLARKITSGGCKVPIIGLSMRDESDVQKKMLDAGAVDYVNKADAPDKLLDAIRKAVANSRG